MRYKKGDKIKCKVTRILPSGVAVELLNDKSKGWIRKRELSWFHDIRPTSYFVKVGADIDTVFIRYEQEADVIQLSLREAYGNPWLSLKKEHGTGLLREGLVTKLYPDGAYVLLLEEGIEGFVLNDQIASGITKPEEKILPGDLVFCCVRDVKEKNQEITLSILDAVRQYEQINIKDTNWGNLAEFYNEESLKYLQSQYGEIHKEELTLHDKSKEIFIDRPVNKILVVEDDEKVRFRLRNLLIRMGYKDVIICSTGEDAISIFKEYQPDWY